MRTIRSLLLVGAVAWAGALAALTVGAIVGMHGASNGSLAETAGITPASGSSFEVDLADAHVPIEDVEGIHLVISG